MFRNLLHGFVCKSCIEVSQGFYKGLRCRGLENFYEGLDVSFCSKKGVSQLRKDAPNQVYQDPQVHLDRALMVLNTWNLRYSRGWLGCFGRGVITVA